MAGLTDAVRGGRAKRALARLEGGPLRVVCERQRFSDSPPPYTSNPSGTTTRSASPNPPSEEQLLREQRRQLAREARASEPDQQFTAQVEEERRRIWNADPRTSWRSTPFGDTFIEEASETVKKRWAEQGIWNNNWNQFAYGLWKHEEPLELESESETDKEAESSPLFSFFPKQPQPKPTPKSDDEKRRIVERRMVREHEREASRPYHQFIYQISKERERIQDEPANEEGAGAADINTRAYENVKNTWSKRGIWSKRWGILPGMLWKHEQPLEAEIADRSAPVPANPLVNGSHEVGEVPDICLFGSPPVEPDHRQTSNALNSSQQGPPADINLAGLENGDAERSSSAPISPRLSIGKRVHRPRTGQASRPSRKKPSHKDGLPQATASAALGPVHSSKVSKAAVKKKPRPQRRLNISPKVSSDDLPLSSGVSRTAAQSRPRNSAQKQKDPTTAPSVAKDLTGTACTDPSTRVVRPKPKRNIASNPTTKSSAKLQGILPRPPAKTTRGKARGK
ncbi:MAG: hypothetical protein FRX48_09277 [Lasallia pustulata]|uniref:Uncharacterized protein n=1 Tax=Lasallia pustulata TaxID=136370 RepID=A0A5M8PCE7_9LECA|nr:MAG: hypothetical protein FRX48_09277 [Lasallia pustulata]